MAPPDHVVRKVYPHLYVQSSPPHQGRVLRGTKQRPDIREQSNLVAKEQSACKEEESIYRRSLAIYQQSQGIAIGNLDDFALMDGLSRYRYAGQQQEKGQIAHMPNMAMKTPAQPCTRRGVAEVLPASR